MEDSNHHRAIGKPTDKGLGAPPQASHSQLIAMQWRTERGDLDLDNFLLAIYFMRLGTLVDRAYDQHCQKEYGVGGGDMRVLLALRRGGPPYVKRPTDLFRALLVTSGAITKKVDRLVTAGYAERLPDPTHGGGFLVHLTKKGMQVVESAIDHLADHSVLAPAMAQFAPDERKRGIDFVLRVLSQLESTAGPLDEPEEPSAPARPNGRKRRA
ncbi:MAG: MarR family transcriptional regulator [Variovorax sp.]|nr:MarR family transcriptional regulator [Variovorax sp.]